jgi:hypothetical protein
MQLVFTIFLSISLPVLQKTVLKLVGKLLWLHRDMSRLAVQHHLVVLAPRNMQLSLL